MIKPIPLMLLGTRRIAWNVIKMLMSEPYSEYFNLRVLVTDEMIWEQFKSLYPNSDAVFITAAKRQNDRIRQEISRHSISVLLSIQYNWILPSDVLEHKGVLAFNLHNARLPDYKGYHSITHAISRGDKFYDSTVHWMVAQVDSGDIAYVERTPINDDDTAISLYLRSIDSAMRAVQHLLDDLIKADIPPKVPMPARPAKFFDRDSIKRFSDVTEKVDVSVLSRAARAAFFPPYNTAYFVEGNKRYLIIPEDEVKPFLMKAEKINLPEFNFEEE